MTVFKCKMCGADIEVEEGKSTARCAYCRTTQTLPVIRSGNDELRGLYNRANILRLKSEFDKAEEVYEKILLKDGEQSEAYWGVLLCKYGIEYVDDPASGQRIPTCHRASFEAMTADEYYKLALSYADAEQKSIYESEAKYIDNVQKEILAISSREQPYDVFICYKESDNGTRTRDSVIANDIYHQLTEEGFKVFYAAISLEDKLGSSYEPIIFAALNSAKVMLAIGTKPEYLNAVWVKNEWSRYLKIIKNDRKKLLIPCYKDMDAYELPEEFSHLQAQDMGKIGFITDIIRGVKKVLESFKEKPAVNNITNVTNVTNRTTNVSGGAPAAVSATAPLLERAFMFLEDGEFSDADAYAEKALDINPKEPEAYLVKLLCELKLKNRNDLRSLKEPFTASKNCEKVLRFGDDELKKEIEGYNAVILKRIEEEAQRQAEAELKKQQERLEKHRQFIEYAEKNKDKIAFASTLMNCGTWHLAALKSDGTVFTDIMDISTYNYNDFSGAKSLSSWRNVRSISTYGDKTFGVTKLNRVLVPEAQYTDSFKEFALKNTNVKRLAIGHFNGEVCIAAVNNDGTISCSDRSVGKIRGTYVDVAVGNCVYGLTADGNVVSCYGYNSYTKFNNVAKIYATRNFLACITTKGTVVIDDNNLQTHVADWKNIVKLEVCSDISKNHVIVGLTEGGKVLTFTNWDVALLNCPDGEWKDIADIKLSSDGKHLICVTKYGTVYSSYPLSEKKVNTWENVIAVAATTTDDYGLTADGKILSTKSPLNVKLFNSLDTIFEEYGDAGKTATVNKSGNTNELSKADIKARLDRCKEEWKVLLQEYSKLGIFSGKRKREISARQFELDAEISKLEAMLKK